MSLEYFCDRCGVNCEKKHTPVSEDFCPKCAKEYKKWFKGKEKK